jgi:hypothetical protein
MNPSENNSSANHDRIARLAYKYSQQKRYANFTAEENWCRAERQLGLSRRNVRPFVAEKGDGIKPVAELVIRPDDK